MRLSPVPFADPERITPGDRSRVGYHVHLWAGDREGRIIIGKECLLAPGTFVTGSDCSLDAEPTIKSQITRERDIVVGHHVRISRREWRGSYA